MFLGSREYYIRKIMTTYNYDRENAEKSFEYMKHKRASYTFGKMIRQEEAAAAAVTPFILNLPSKSLEHKINSYL